MRSPNSFKKKLQHQKKKINWISHETMANFLGLTLEELQEHSKKMGIRYYDADEVAAELERTKVPRKK